MTAVPTTPKGLRTWGTILGAAREVFGRDGYVAARMGDVATAAGLSTGGLYRYFANKEDLFQALIEGIHEELYDASRSTGHQFAAAPYEALLGANTGYLSLYRDNRLVMRAFIEAASVDDRFQKIWWDMRRRHADRFATAMRTRYGVDTVAGVPVEIASDAMACLVEQCAYVWFGHADLMPMQIDVETAAKTVTHTWYQTFFSESGEPRA